jgi:simple sugar transport system permease protein
VLLLAVIVVVQLIRRRWLAAAGGIVGAAVLYFIYYSVDELPTELTAYAPHLVTLVVLAVASQRLRPPAADGVVYRRGEGD